MKKTFPVNINGKVFYIDEDAYTLLQNYLAQLRSAFPDTDGEEIVSDIEARISELFDEQIASGAAAIVYNDVNHVIDVMGQPSDIGDLDNEDNNRTDDSPNNTDTNPDAAKSDNQEAVPPQFPEQKAERKLFRNMQNKVFGGVIGGLAVYLGWDANIMRLLVIVLSLVSYGWPLMVLYLIAWMVIPPANTPRRILEMHGQPVTVSSIGKNVLSSTPPPYPGYIQDSISSVFSILGKCIIAFLGIIGVVGTLISTGFFFYFFVALIAASCFDSVTLLTPLSYYADLAPHLVASTSMCFTLCFLIPSMALAWIGGSTFFNFKPATKEAITFALVLETLIIVATIILSVYLNNIHLQHYL